VSYKGRGVLPLSYSPHGNLRCEAGTSLLNVYWNFKLNVYLNFLAEVLWTSE